MSTNKDVAFEIAQELITNGITSATNSRLERASVYTVTVLNEENTIKQAAQIGESFCIAKSSEDVKFLDVIRLRLAGESSSIKIADIVSDEANPNL